MKIIVVGCGKIGTALIASLVSEGHNVTAIDNNPSVIKDVSNIYDVMTACGSGTDCDLLAEAETETADLFISVTGSDELNMLSCFLAKRMGAKHTVARIRNPEYNEGHLHFLKKQLGLSIAVNPERLVARELFNLLKLPSAANVETFSGRNLEIVQLRLKQDSPLDGIRLMDLRKKFPLKFLVCVVQREEAVYIPDGTFVLRSGDKIGLTATPSEIQKLLKMLGIAQKQARSVMILGASHTAYYLAKMLLASGNAVKILEKDPARCREISEVLPDAVVLQGDGAQQELLLEEGLAQTDAFVALTGMDEENILLSYFASSLNVPKVISKVNRDEFVSMAERLGLESIVSPKKAVANIIVRYARALECSMDSNVETLYRLMNGEAEALEFTVGPDCNLTGIPLKDLQLKKNVLIAGIIRGKISIIPTGADEILPEDKVIVLAAGHRIQNLSEIAQQ